MLIFIKCVANDKFLNIKNAVVFYIIFRHFPLNPLATKYHCLSAMNLQALSIFLLGLVVYPSEDIYIGKNVY